MLSLENWIELSPRVSYNLYEAELQAKMKLKEELAEAIEVIKGYEEGEDSFTKDQRKANRAGLL